MFRSPDVQVPAWQMRVAVTEDRRVASVPERPLRVEPALDALLLRRFGFHEVGPPVNFYLRRAARSLGHVPRKSVEYSRRIIVST
jgi:hypothetical protein